MADRKRKVNIMSKIVGIDLGTTFSALAILNSIGKPEIVPNSDGDRLTSTASQHDLGERIRENYPLQLTTVTVYKVW